MTFIYEQKIYQLFFLSISSFPFSSIHSPRGFHCYTSDFHKVVFLSVVVVYLSHGDSRITSPFYLFYWSPSPSVLRLQFDLFVYLLSFDFFVYVFRVRLSALSCLVEINVTSQKFPTSLTTTNVPRETSPLRLLLPPHHNETKNKTSFIGDHREMFRRPKDGV